MAMIYCPACGKEISDTAKQCPNCGHEFKKKGGILKKIVIVAAIIFVLLIVIGLIGSRNSVTPEFKRAMDSYEQFFDEYIDFMNEYSNASNPVAMLADYTTMLGKYSDAMTKMGQVNIGQLSEADRNYYLEVTERIQKKLAGVAGQ